MKQKTKQSNNSDFRRWSQRAVRPVQDVTPLPGGLSTNRRRRKGAVVVWTSLVMITLVGMVGLIIDGGLMMAAHRHAQNAADAAAMGAAMAKLRGKSVADAIADGVALVNDTTANDLPNATATINNPPASGPYAGSTQYFEALVSSPNPTYFIHVFPGINAGIPSTGEPWRAMKTLPREKV